MKRIRQKVTDCVGKGPELSFTFLEGKYSGSHQNIGFSLEVRVLWTGFG